MTPLAGGGTRLPLPPGEGRGEGRPGRHQGPALLIAYCVAAAFGFLAASFQLQNTSIGWHLACGRWILDHGAVPRADAFSFTAQGTPWIDHEWLFQVVAAAIEGAGGPAALVLWRGLWIALLAVLLVRIGLQSGLHHLAALLLAVLCIWGARLRFFVRPELFTLLIAPCVVALFLERHKFRALPFYGALAALMVVGGNAHAGILIVPPLLAALLFGELAYGWRSGRVDRSQLASGAGAVALAAAVPLLNPYGWKLYWVPIEITNLVGRDYILNPEWISPAPLQTPGLYLAFGAALLLLLLARDRSPLRWILLLAAGALAFRYVRNLGLFFVLLPLAVAPALAKLPGCGRQAAEGSARLVRRALQGAAWALPPLVALGFIVDQERPFGFQFDAGYYPIAACDFLQRERLPAARLYNDVKFGGYLLERFFPPRTVFIDDRNEIHEPLLRRIFSILRRSDTRGWERLLAGYSIDTALVRYVPQLTEVLGPDRRPRIPRSFSALWFPARRWALVYWDDVAMVLVRRAGADPDSLGAKEYRVVRPDDLEYLRRGLAAGWLDRAAFLAELRRKLKEQPDCQRARLLLTLAQQP